MSDMTIPFSLIGDCELWYCLIVLLNFISTRSVHSLCMNQDKGAVCARNDRTRTCCDSLQSLVENITATDSEDAHNIEIQVLQDITLDSVVSFRNFESMIIQSRFKLECENYSNHTGLYFQNMTDLVLLNLTIVNCGMLQLSTTPKPDNESQYQLTWCATYFINSTDLTIIDVTISKSRGAGLVIYDTDGTVAINGSLFEDNTLLQADKEYPGGGGMNIEFKYCNPDDSECQITNTTYRITNSNFIGNYASELKPTDSAYGYYHSKFYQGHGRGGGLALIMRGNSSMNKVYVTNCQFINNTATTWGGGAYVSLRDYPTGNIVAFSDCKFEDNSCEYFGGGGLNVALLSYEGTAASNELSFKNCNFTSNHAKVNGGGLGLVATREDNLENAITQLNNTILFQDCSWHRNEAAWGSAVDISPALWDVLGNGILPTPLFSRCSFTENHVTENTTELPPGIMQSTRGIGTLLISNFVVKVSESLEFIDNDSTALYLLSGLLYLNPGTNVTFIGNKAHEGGAVALYSFSVVYMSSNVNIKFINNTAKIRGGAIYAFSSDKNERYSSRSCFIQIVDRNSKKTSHNVTITFEGNTAGTGGGNSIHTTSLNPCSSVFMFRTSESSPMDKPIKMIGLTKDDVTTSHYRFSPNKFDLHQLIPGQFFMIPIIAYDELDKPISVIYDTALDTTTQTYLDVASYVSNTTLRLKSQGNMDENQLLLSNGLTTLSINITVVQCPPGHVISRYNVCTCETSNFKGIWKCERGRKVASIINGYWIGLCGRTQCTGHCPVGFCNNDISTDLQNVTIYDTHKLLCINNREGKLCGRCSANHSVYYHSYFHKCGDESLCNFGILFYAVSEILPLTIVFVIVIMLNVSFTSGAVNGLILYAQIFDSFVTNFHNIVHFPKFVGVLIDGYRVVYTTSNLNYFSIEKLSFCLWKGATTLDVIAWQYVTILYALCLIVVTVFLLNTTACKKLCICLRPHTVKNAAIHGLIAFLVMCYSQCAKVSFLLLTRASLDGNKFNKSEDVVFLSGENKLFDKEHIKYAIPALFFMLIIVILPPMLLILYPLSFKILALCRLSELKIVNRIANFIPIQLFDSFQSCYKDDLRFFSGLYFFYRVVPLILFAVSTDLILFYFSVEVFLVIALALSATLQPYKNRWHNITDSLIFTNLAIINAISLYNYQKINEGKDHLKSVKETLTITTVFQLFLIYLPLFSIFICVLWMLMKWAAKKALERKISKLDYSQETLLDSTFLPPLRDRNSTRDSAMEFHEFK